MQIQLGESVNLLHGLAPTFPNTKIPWTRPKGTPLVTEPAVPLQNTATWQPIEVTFCQSIDALLDALFDYSVVPMNLLDGPLDIQPSHLMRDTAPKDLAMGLGCTEKMLNAPGFLLVQLQADRSVQHFSPEHQHINRKRKITNFLNDKGRHAMARLRLREMRKIGVNFHGDFTARQAQRYLKYFDDFGTHVIKTLKIGELLWQIVALSPDHIDQTAQFFNQNAQADKLSGPGAFGAQVFASMPWATRVGKIMTCGGAHLVGKISQDPIWNAHPPRLLDLAIHPAEEIERVMSQFDCNSITGAQFCAQALYMEDFRADALTRVLQTAFLQRFPKIQKVGWRQRGKVDPVAFVDSAGLSGVEALCVRSQPASHKFVMALALDNSPALRLGKDDITTLWLRASNATQSLSEIDVNAATFNPDTLKAIYVDGSLRIKARNQQDVHTLADGLWLGQGQDGKQVISSAPCEPTTEDLHENLSRLRVFCVLLDQLRGPAISPDMSIEVLTLVDRLLAVCNGQPSLNELSTDLHWIRHNASWRGKSSNSINPIVDTDVFSNISQFLRIPSNDQSLMAQNETMCESWEKTLNRGFNETQFNDALNLKVSNFTEAIKQFRDQYRTEETDAVLSALQGIATDQNPAELPTKQSASESPSAQLWNSVLCLRATIAGARAFYRPVSPDSWSQLGDQIISLAQVPLTMGGILQSAMQKLWPDVTGLNYFSNLYNELTQCALSTAQINQTLIWDHKAPLVCCAGPQMKRLIMSLQALNLACLNGAELPPLKKLEPEMIRNSIKLVHYQFKGVERPKTQNAPQKQTSC